MTDPEIKQYLDKYDWAIYAQNAIMDIFNTSPQIINKEYNFEKHIMKVITPENIFIFKWLLGHQ